MAAATAQKQERDGPYVHLDLSFHLSGESKFDFSLDDDEESLGSSVKSGLRNSLHSSFDFSDLLDHHMCLRDADALEEDDSDSSGVGSLEGRGEHEEVPSWRLDPDESGSDWTIAIESVPDGVVTKYYVHKSVLAGGLKKSDFFVSLFNLSAEMRVEDEGFSVSKVHADAAKLIPDMLDYLYSIHDILKVSTETVVGLRHLSEFFGIRAMSREALCFIYKDMTIENMKTYLLSASDFDDLQVRKLCAKRCAERIQDIQPYSELLAKMDPSLLLDILSSQKSKEKCVSVHMSKLMSVFCELHYDILDGAVFEELTSVEYLPVISEDCAFDLLILEAGMVDDALDEQRGLTYLQKRCVDALSPPLIQLQIELDANELRSRAKKLKKLLKKAVLAELLSGALCVS
jgi:hypothetical protein